MRSTPGLDILDYPWPGELSQSIFRNVIFPYECQEHFIARNPATGPGLFASGPLSTIISEQDAQDITGELDIGELLGTQKVHHLLDSCSLLGSSAFREDGK